MIRAIIIDDEHYGRQSVKNALAQYCPEVNIVETCETPEKGIEAILALKPDLVFLDVQMPNMSGFDLLNHLSPIHFEVIFVTSFDKYAIKAIRFSALDYLLKPLDIDDLQHAVARTKEQLKRKTPQRYESVLHNIKYSSGKVEKIAVPTTEGIDFFITQEILYLQAEGSYTKLFLSNGNTYLVSKNLKDFESLLSESGFFRIHNSYLVQVSHIKKYIKGEGGYVVLPNGQHLDVSRRKKDAFLSILNRI